MRARRDHLRGRSRRVTASPGSVPSRWAKASLLALCTLCLAFTLVWTTRAQPAPAVGSGKPAAPAAARPEGSASAAQPVVRAPAQPAGGTPDERADASAKPDQKADAPEAEVGGEAADQEAADGESAEGEAAEPEGEPEDPLTPEEKSFLADLHALTRSPHRLAASESGRAAAAYVEQRLRQVGVREVYPLDMPVWQTRTVRCELKVGERTVPLHPLRPNVVIPPVTPKEGITGPLLYAGQGTFAEYRDRRVTGAIVVLDYDSFDNWERAFALGARAVIFLGRGDETPHGAKHAGVPSNQIRLYADRTQLDDLDLRQDRKRATVVSQVAWAQRIGRNLIARIPGTDPRFSAERQEPEALVLAVHYDSFGVVPELSPGARSAGNVAALLAAAARYQARPPRRDLLLLFLDNESRGHQGSREVYAALQMAEEQSERQRSEHEQEIEHLRAMQELLRTQGLVFSRSSHEAVPGVNVSVWLGRALQQQADHARDDARNQLIAARLAAQQGAGTQQSLAELDAQVIRWDELRRALYDDELGAFVRERANPANAGGEPAAFRAILAALTERLSARFDRRLVELESALSIDRQRRALRRGLGFTGGDDSTWIVLHATFNFSDQASKWGIVVGDWTNRLFSWRPPKTEGDTPGFYGRVLNAIAEVKGDTQPSHLDVATLADPNLGHTFAPGPFFSSGSVAGAYGIYNLSLMTGYDARPRDGHPADTLAHLRWRTLMRQAKDGAALMRRLADNEAISLPRVFKDFATNKLPSWDAGQSKGDYAGLQVSGSLAEHRPAAGAMLALWPGQKGSVRMAWNSLSDADQGAVFEPIALEPVDENGRFRVVSFRADMHEEVMSIGALFDSEGRLQAVSTTDQQAQKLTDSMRVDLFFGRAGAWTALRTYETKPELLKLLKASTDGLFRDNSALWGQLGNHGFFYVSDQAADPRVKLFQPMGEVVLGEFSDRRPAGNGVASSQFAQGKSLSEATARDLWELNEWRLRKLRERGVSSADLELLHSRARRAQERSRAASTVAGREAERGRSAALSHRVYLPLRTTMDDLVHAIVLLLLLAIPFAFAMERLLVCATSIYGRIAWFTGLFLLTFALLYWLHPGFAIASTPMIIFLAFAIVLLSTLVIYIVVRKFKTELRAMQGHDVGVHELGVSRTATMLAAVGMGMSTMRRRPTRTALTAITVVMLTFTISSFASFSRTLGVRSIYQGPVSDQTAAGVLVRKLDYSKLPGGVLDMLHGLEGEGGLLAPQYWLVRETDQAPRLSVARVDTGKSMTVDAIMGLVPEELERWPQLTASLGPAATAEKKQALGQSGVYLPSVVVKALELRAGDAVLLNGHSVQFAGTLDGPTLQRIKHLDQESLLPVDFIDAASKAPGGTQPAQQTEDEMLLAEEAERNFVHLSADQIAVTSASVVRHLGGQLHAITVHPGEGVAAVELGRRVAEVVVMPVWAAGAGGVERLILTVLTDVSGGFALFVPLLLGGLIIFGTLLGSISDREKEIYTFSALGLSPGHVGVLFFAEAAVYGVVGGMGGQLLSQLVGLGATWLARAGHIGPTSINYSSTNSLFAIGVVMATVLVSAIYPAVRASKSANPGLARAWKMPPADGDQLSLTFPFTVSAYDITGVVSFLAEHFRRHDDAGLGSFAASNVSVGETADGHLELCSDLALAPFDLGVTQHLRLTAVPSEIEGVDEVAIEVQRNSGAQGDWYRANRVFLRDLRRQFLLWRTLSAEMIEEYRMQTLELLGATAPPSAESSTQEAAEEEFAEEAPKASADSQEPAPQDDEVTRPSDEATRPSHEPVPAAESKKPEPSEQE